MVTTIELEKLRPLGKSFHLLCHSASSVIPLLTSSPGNLESSLATWNSLKFHYNLGVTGYYILQPFSSVISLESTVYAALAQVLTQHPILSAIPITTPPTPEKPYFARLPSFDLQNCVTFTERQLPFPGPGHDPELDKLLETPHNEPFENTSNDTPFWRLLVLTPEGASSDHTFTASFIWHPALGDMESGVIFHRCFLEALNSSPTPLKSAMFKPPKEDLLLPLEGLHTFPVTLKKRFQTFISAKFASIPRGIWAGNLVMEKGARKFRSFTLGEEVSRGFRELCQMHSTTVQATLQIIVAAELFGMLDRKFLRVTAVVPVSLRGWLNEKQVGEGAMGSWGSVIHDSYTRDEVGVGFGGEVFKWDEAKRAKGVVVRYLEERGRDNAVGLLRYVGDFEKYWWSKVGKPREGAFEVADAGAFNARKEKPEAGEAGELNGGHGEEWRMGRMVISQSAGITQAAICISVVTGGDGGLTLGFAWQETVVEGDKVKKLMREMERVMGELVEHAEKKAAAPASAPVAAEEEKPLPDVPEDMGSPISLHTALAVEA